MSRTYNRKQKRNFSEVKIAAALVYMRKTSTSVRETAKLYCLPRTTLQRRSKLNQKYVPRGRKPILTENAYREVFRRSITASFSVEVRRIAYEVALEQETHIPQSWIQNAMAGVDWCLNFFKKYPHLKKIWAKKSVEKSEKFLCCVCEERYDRSDVVLCISCCGMKCIHCYNPKKCLQKDMNHKYM